MPRAGTPSRCPEPRNRYDFLCRKIRTRPRSFRLEKGGLESPVYRVHRMSITIELPENIRQDLEKFRRERGISMEEAAQEALGRFLVLQRFNQLAVEGEKHLRAAGFTNEDDILKAFST